MRAFATAAGVFGLLALGACGSEDPPATPSACVGPPSAYLAALESAPESAELEGGTPIGDCLVEEQEPGALASVGESLVGAATELNRRALRDPGGEASVQLGYLVGSAEEAAESTGGIHADLILRLNSAARYAGRAGAEGSLGAEFERAFGEGYAATQTSD